MVAYKIKLVLKDLRESNAKFAHFQDLLLLLLGEVLDAVDCSHHLARHPLLLARARLGLFRVETVVADEFLVDR